MILYHIGKRPPQPVPKMPGKDPWYGEGGRKRKNRKLKKDAKVVFLSNRPLSVFKHHGISGHVYAVNVPEWVVRKSGGLQRYDCASEIIIEEPLWQHCKLLGRAKQYRELFWHHKYNYDFPRWCTCWKQGLTKVEEKVSQKANAKLNKKIKSKRRTKKDKRRKAKKRKKSYFSDLFF